MTSSDEDSVIILPRKRTAEANKESASIIIIDDDEPFVKPSARKLPKTLKSTQDYLSNDSPLSQDQKNVYRMVISERKSLFYTGSAGTGKSFLLKVLIQQLKKMHGHDAVAVTASTGIAAYSIGGSTLHSFSGAGLANQDRDKLVDIILKNKKSYNRWVSCKVLIIDEISMIEGDFFDKLAYIATQIRKNPKPFGGIQLVICGDFM
jgi:ATP-dependent DNA helicase PIF1